MTEAEAREREREMEAEIRAREREIFKTNCAASSDKWTKGPQTKEC